MTDINWTRDGLSWHATILNGWAATVWDFGSHPDNIPHPEGQPFNWGVRPAMSLDAHDREDYAATLAEAQAEAERNLRELAATPAEQDEELEDLVDAMLGREALAAIAAGEPVVPWEDVVARLDLDDEPTN